MALNVTVVELGGSPRISNNVDTVADVANALNIASDLSVTVNGKSASYTTTLSDYDFISFGSKVKGGNQ